MWQSDEQRHKRRLFVIYDEVLTTQLPFQWADAHMGFPRKPEDLPDQRRRLPALSRTRLPLGHYQRQPRTIRVTASIRPDGILLNPNQALCLVSGYRYEELHLGRVRLLLRPSSDNGQLHAAEEELFAGLARLQQGKEISLPFHSWLEHRDDQHHIDVEGVVTWDPTQTFDAPEGKFDFIGDTVVANLPREPWMQALNERTLRAQYLNTRDQEHLHELSLQVEDVLARTGRLEAQVEDQYFTRYTRVSNRLPESSHRPSRGGAPKKHSDIHKLCTQIVAVFENAADFWEVDIARILAGLKPTISRNTLKDRLIKSDPPLMREGDSLIEICRFIAKTALDDQMPS